MGSGGCQRAGIILRIAVAIAGTHVIISWRFFLGSGSVTEGVHLRLGCCQ